MLRQQLTTDHIVFLGSLGSFYRDKLPQALQDRSLEVQGNA